MTPDWLRRAPARPWLLLRPGSAGQPWDWLLVERGQPSREGQGEPPAHLAGRIALIVPAQLCSHFQLPAPPGLKREEWPLLLEERLLQGSEEVLCACLQRLPGQLRLAVVARAALEGWREQCAQWGLVVERTWAEMQLLPVAQPGCGWSWRRDEGVELLKGTASDGQEHWLCWPGSLGEVPSRPWSELSLASMAGRWPTRLMALDGLPGLFESPRLRQPHGLPRSQVRLAAGCLLLAAVWGGLWLSQQWRQGQLYRQQVIAVTGEQTGVRQAAWVLKRLQQDQHERRVRLRQLEGLQAQLQQWLSEHPGWRLQAVRFDGQRWHVRLAGEGAGPAWQTLAGAAGAKVEVSDDGQPGQWQAVFDLGAA
ncbi:general secretion pathway protein L [Pseudomonas hunanensis]|uniref:General secretion pathway protein L n=1 Tax=Pseudomonas hunanensis TaxID=1247546 RepID=A0ACC6K606_9PSED|nr:type II secretion system protein GspL [Pseudomonas hunanensis]MDR6713831.1 general secretion pathway protein L [Pseudomonas hunanensis]